MTLDTSKHSLPCCNRIPALMWHNGSQILKSLRGTSDLSKPGSTRLSRKNCIEREEGEGGEGKRRIKRNSDNFHVDGQDVDKGDGDHYQEDGWIKEGMPEL